MFETYIVRTDRFVTIHKSAAQLHTIAAGYRQRVVQFTHTAVTATDETAQTRWSKKHDRMLNNAMSLIGLANEADRSLTS